MQVTNLLLLTTDVKRVEMKKQCETDGPQTIEAKSLEIETRKRAENYFLKVMGVEVG